MKAAVAATSLFLTSVGGPVFLLTTGHTVGITKAQMTDSTGKDLDGYSTSTPLSVVLPVLQKLGIAKS